MSMRMNMCEYTTIYTPCSNCELLKLRIRHGCPKRKLSAHVARAEPANCCFKLINFVFISNSSNSSSNNNNKKNNNNNNAGNENRGKKLLFFNFMLSFAIIFTLFANLRAVVSFKAIFAPH